jgi:hypothetical protein
MKRIRLLVLAGVIAAALPFGMVSAGATGSHPPANSVSIRDKAQYDLVGLQIHVGVTVKCQPQSVTNTLGAVDVTVTQKYPETPYPTGAMGTGINSVVCDGRARSVAVSVPLGIFDAGKAHAKAVVRAGTENPVGGLKVAESSRQIQIVNV